ncbi:hypothetical protein HDG34_002535 [Paraburkholderia sp. HC6.4b]|uniref:hypothetical protein n=1 Tax=unclassified Paraburkholderia TaxID=2615204 RepID=UPI001617FA6D|nr:MULTISPECIES: hypothetical protein [unclassified Paraburkholderia]MBB5408598.1 hypothetical protein [Paraburkholderia sp. HC6.4b]MBB5450430.1 hypothetical protein [Paraburkholderia sp. Kb1A]
MHFFLVVTVLRLTTASALCLAAPAVPFISVVGVIAAVVVPELDVIAFVVVPVLVFFVVVLLCIVAVARLVVLCTPCARIVVCAILAVALGRRLAFVILDKR